MEDNNPTEGGTFEIFESAEALQASMNQSEAPVQEAPAQEAPAQEAAPVETQEAPVQETPYVDPEAAPAEPTQETFEPAPEPQVQQQQTQDYSDQEIEGAVMSFLSERLGRDITSLEDLSPVTEPASPLDERVEAIAKFVQETGRSPQDWFTYQSLNPYEMDEVMAVWVRMAKE